MREAYQGLSDAIVLQAVKDYRRAIKYPQNKEAQDSKDEIEEFFRSDWYKTLTSINSELLMSRLKEVIK